MTAVGGVNELAPPNRAQAIEPHRFTYPVAAYAHTTPCYSSCQSAAVASTVAGSKCGFQMNAGSAYHWFSQALLNCCLVGVIARAADFKDVTPEQRQLVKKLSFAGLQRAGSSFEFSGKGG